MAFHPSPSFPTANQFSVSATEQSLACSDEPQAHLRDLKEKLASDDMTSADKMRLAILYALRYEASANLDDVKEKMALHYVLH